MKKYSTVLFDLDHTLWDYDKNSRETLTELYDHHRIDQFGYFGFEDFHDAFQKVNLHLWDQHDRGLIDRHYIRDQRFPMVLSEFSVVDADFSNRLSEHYMTLSPTKKNLIPHAVDVLEYLMPRYPLYLVTNGFDEIQSTKVSSGGIEKYFKAIVTSEKAGHKKPAREIFDYTLQKGGHANSEALMIGDNLLTDIAGARNAGIDSVLFNPKKQKHSATVAHEISDLLELKEIL
jgi:YjjG family noncanonical pyrimidine nucleotidase